MPSPGRPASSDEPQVDRASLTAARHVALEHIPNVEAASDLPRIDRSAVAAGVGAAGDDIRTPVFELAGQFRRHGSCECVSDSPGFGVTARRDQRHDGDRQHRPRRTWRPLPETRQSPQRHTDEADDDNSRDRPRPTLASRWPQPALPDARARFDPAVPQVYPVHFDRTRDVLDLLYPEVLEREAELVEHLVAYRPADTDLPRQRQRLQARRDIDAIPENVVAVDNDVADVDAEAKFEAVFGGHARIAIDHSPLHVDRAANGIDHTGKLEQQTIAGRLDNPAAKFGDLGVDQVAPVRLQRRERAAFVLLHETGIARHIGRDDCCQSTLVPRHPLPSAEAGCPRTIVATPGIHNCRVDARPRSGIQTRAPPDFGTAVRPAGIPRFAAGCESCRARAT